jgi:dinuclear metal center YbgI/SA1388 family protein
MQPGSITHKPGRYRRRVPTAATADILAELDRLLKPDRFEDYCVNGLQVPGPDRVAHVATGVSAHAELFELAAKARADLVLVHHGLFWGPGFRAIDVRLKQRLELLFDNDMALAAYHLPLDAHPTLGNNALLAKALGARDTDIQPFAPHRGQPIGALATLPEGGTRARDLFEQIATLTNRQPTTFDAGPETIARLAIVAGAGGGHIEEAAALGADALLTGEIAERAMAEARELGIHLIAGGHYATETFGIKALGEHLAAHFDVVHTFLDVPNPV